MTEHLYTPSGMESSGGSSKFKGNDAAMVELLELAEEEGIDLQWEHGTVSYSESGYAEEDGYDPFGSGSYSWHETTDTDLSLSLGSHGCLSVSHEEIIPEDYWDEKDCEGETFEPTGNEGVNAERQYSDQDAIVVWPRSQSWVVLADNNLTRMCNLLLESCSTESKAECKIKARTCINRCTLVWMP